MRKPNKSELDKKTKRCIAWIRERKKKGCDAGEIIYFAMGVMGEPNEYEGIDGVDYLPFEIIKACFEKGE